ncbi:MAG: alginate lyase family protein [candidate division KSB1 bacterium]|nr:alginate lyase family protein [candidate division KSB1 bacterium]
MRMVLASAVLVLGASASIRAGEGRPFVLLRPEELAQVRLVVGEHPDLVGLRNALRAYADSALRLGPWSVTFLPSRAASGDPHDYYSEAPYWWPDPRNPAGPYVRRDGRVNPHHFSAHRTALGELANTALTLATAWYVLGDTACARRAAELVRIWFVDPATRMNPHLRYAQAIPGLTDGRPSGIIDGRRFIWLVQALAMLESWSGWPADQKESLRIWFHRYFEWLTSSEAGKRESRSLNNHATWYTAQWMAIASYLGDSAAVAHACEHFRSHLVPTQIQSNGSCPQEEARTRSLSYSAMNLDGFTVICRLARNWGSDLYSFELPNGASVRRAIDYLLPYLVRPATWTKEQITPFVPTRRIFLALAGLDLRRPDLLDLYLALPSEGDAIHALLELAVQARRLAGEP